MGASGFLIVEPDPSVAEVIADRIERRACAKWARSRTEALEKLSTRSSARWTGLVVEPELEDGDGLDVLHIMRERQPSIPALVLAHSSDRCRANRACALGATWAYKPEGIDFVEHFVDQALAQGSGVGRDVAAYLAALGERAKLSGAEKRIVELAVAGLTHEEICQERGVSRGTLRTQITSILDKIGGDNLDRAVISIWTSVGSPRRS